VGTKYTDSGGTVGADSMIKRGQVARLLGVCERTVSRMVADGQFPKPIKIRGAARWLVADVLRFRDNGRGLV
jgi:predicted DNA-binding transcriptional regulator AlpA